MRIAPGGFNILPLAVKNLLIINGIFFLATLTFNSAFGIDLYRILGLHFFGASDFAPYQLVTYMFMHGGFTHLFFNMFALWMFGNVLENVWGPRRFLVYYFITGLGAALIHYIVVYFQMLPELTVINQFIANPTHEALQVAFAEGYIKAVSPDSRVAIQQFIELYNQMLDLDRQEALVQAVGFMNQYRIDFLNAPVVVGASGAVFGILLAFGMMFPNALIYVFFAIPIKAKYFVMIYGAMELGAGLFGRDGNIAHFAHLGGMLFGFFLIRYWRSKKNRPLL
ncbi:MAG TPA: rhomboid family intramembrane serine protease [Bacteroidales bacterium]|nr:rhomboid family intramembrane serine protease [Bacteroidales bacterium]